jgi:hypothetical protein
MKTNDFTAQVTSSKLNENLNKMFGVKVNLEQYSREQLEDMRNKLRTRVFQQEGRAGVNELLTNETYQKNKAMLDLLNTRIKEMLGENIKNLRNKMLELSEAKKGVRAPKYTKKAAGTKPDFLDKDKDGDKKEPMKKAIKDKKVAEGSKPDFLDLDKDKNKKEPMKKAAKDATVKEGDNPWEKLGARDSDNSPKVGAKKKTSSGGEATKTSSGTVHKAGSKGYGNKWDGKTQDQAPAKPSKAAKTSAEKKAQPKNAGPSTWPKDKTTSHSANWGNENDDGTGDEVKEAKDTETKDASGKVKSWKHEGDWKKASGKEGRGKVTNLSDKARKETEKKAKMKESIANFKHNVRFVNESLGYLLSEDEEGKAKAITSAGDMVNDFTSWMQRVGQYQTKTMIELADAIKADFGAAESEAFKQAVGPALSATLEVLTQQREAVSNAVAVLAGEAAPEAPMGAIPTDEPMMSPTAPDEMNPEPAEVPPAADEFGASDAAAGMGTTGREMRESKFARKLQESHSIMSALSK